MIKAKKQVPVSELDFEKIEKRVEALTSTLIDFENLSEKINNEVDIFNDFYKVDDRYTKIFEVYVDSRAGRYTQKEWIELFNFEIEEEEYNNNLDHYFWIAEQVMFAKFEEILQENLNLNEGVQVYVGYSESGDICLFIVLDYDYIPPQAKENFITGLDIDLLESLESGVSAFKNDYDNIVFLYSIYDYDNDNYLYEIIPEQTKNDIIDDYKEYLIEETDVNNLQEELKRLDTIEGRVMAVYELQRYYGGFFNYLQSAENHIELLQKAGVC